LGLLVGRRFHLLRSDYSREVDSGSATSTNSDSDPNAVANCERYAYPHSDAFSRRDAGCDKYQGHTKF